MDGQRKLKAAKVLLHRRRRPRLAARPLPGRGRRRHARPRRLRRRRRHQPPAPGHPRHAPTSAGPSSRPRTSACATQPAHQLVPHETAARLGERPRAVRRTTTSSSTAPTTSRPATWSTTPACCWASRTSTARSSASRARSSVFCGAQGARATAASTRSRRRPASCPPAPRAACSACCPGIIGSLQATETVKLILGVGDPLIGRLLLYDALKMSFREMKLRKNPECPICAEHPTSARADRLRAVLRHSQSGGGDGGQSSSKFPRRSSSPGSTRGGR